MEIGLALLVFGGLAWLASGGWWWLKTWRRAGRAPAFSARPLLNKSELWLYRTLERWRRDHARTLNLSAQVSYGSFLNAENGGWRSVASKHADFVFWGEGGHVRAIIEFDGAGHYGNSRAEAAKVRDRDRIKNQAALSANIPLIRFPASSTAEDVHRILAEVLILAPQAPTRVRTPDDMVLHDKSGGLR